MDDSNNRAWSGALIDRQSLRNRDVAAAEIETLPIVVATPVEKLEASRRRPLIRSEVRRRWSTW